MKRFEKQPAETLDYDFDFTEFMEAKPGLTIVSHVVPAVEGLTIASVLSGNKVKTYASGGTDGVDYKVTCLVTTSGDVPLVRESEYLLLVKDV